MHKRSLSTNWSRDEAKGPQNVPRSDHEISGLVFGFVYKNTLFELAYILIYVMLGAWPFSAANEYDFATLVCALVPVHGYLGAS